MKVLAVLSLAVALLSGCGVLTTSQPAPTVSVDDSRLPAYFEDGTWTAGQDIQEGTYTTPRTCRGVSYTKTYAGDIAISVEPLGPLTATGGGEITLKNGDSLTVSGCGLAVRQGGSK